MKLSEQIIHYNEYCFPILNDIDIYYKGIVDIKEVIQNAATGLNRNGELDDHYLRILNAKCNIGAVKLLKKINELDKCESFEEIFDIVENVRKTTEGLGDVWSYDTALRIGFHKRFYPKDVYIQAGVRKGAKKFFLEINKEQKLNRLLHINLFEKLIGLEAYQIENFLCIYGKGDITGNLCC